MIKPYYETENKIILDLCGGTGSWSRPYKQAGYDVRLITLPENDVRIYIPPENVYGILAAPPCTEFSFAKHFHGKGKYTYNFIKGLEVVSACMRIILTSSPKFWVLENPNGYLKKWLKEPVFIFEPYFYGDQYQKKTCLWGKFNIPKPQTIKKPEGLIKFSMLKSKDIHSEYYGKLTRQERRAITPAGFANAFFKANNKGIKMDIIERLKQVLKKEQITARNYDEWGLDIECDIKAAIEEIERLSGTCDCKNNMILEKSYCTQCGKDIYQNYD